jgi:hypothetical protein
MPYEVSFLEEPIGAYDTEDEVYEAVDNLLYELDLDEAKCQITYYEGSIQ